MVARKLGLIIILIVSFANLEIIAEKIYFPSFKINTQINSQLEKNMDYSQIDINEMIDNKYAATYNAITFWSWAIGIFIAVFGILTYNYLRRKYNQTISELEKSKRELKKSKNEFDAINEEFNKLKNQIVAILKDIVSSDLKKFNYNNLDTDKEEDTTLLNRLNTINNIEPLAAQQLLAKSIIYARKAKYDEAIKILKQLIDKQNLEVIKKSDLYYKLGYCFSKIGDNSSAIKFYTEAIEIDNKDYASYINRGGIYLLEGLNKKALKDYTKAIEIAPKKTSGWTCLINLYLKERNLEMVKIILDKVNSFNITSENIKYNEICYLTLNNELPKAKEALEKFIKKYPKRKNEILNDGDLIKLLKEYPNINK